MNAIEKLASKLGVAAEHVWEILLTQAPITAITNLSGCILLLSLSIWGLKIAIRNGKEDSWEEPWIGFTVLTGMGAFLGMVFFLIVGADIVTAFINPEYWALEKVVRMLR